ncbi:MAG: glycosyltransferase [Planctomycetaceae bacterium]|nr:glycosyltransferase [Planctomycetaceae bacterium]
MIGRWQRDGGSEISRDPNGSVVSESQGGLAVRVVALVESVDHVCCRYRVAAFRNALAAHGHSLDIRPLPLTTFGRLGIGRDFTADAVIIQRKLLPSWAIALLRRRVPRLIFDFDDAVWLRDSYSPRGFHDPRRTRRFRATVSACDLVIAGNEFLAEAARTFTSPDRVVVIPTCVEPSHYPVATHEPRSGLQLVWVGSRSTLRGLEQFTPTLSAIGRAVPGVRLKLICDKFLQIPDLPVDECVWREDTEAAEIAAADVGIGWVPDDPWSHGKCGLKVIQYQAAGLPVIANPVGVQTEMVRDEETGHLATSTEEWVAAVSRLANDARLRQQLGSAGRRQVHERYSVAAGGRGWFAALHRLRVESLRKSG